MRTDRLLKWLNVGLYPGGLLVLIIIVCVPIASLVLYSQIRSELASRHPALTFVDFLNSANWMQMVVAWGALIVTLGAAFSIAYQIKSLRDQVNLEHERTEREYYRLLSTPEMQSTRKLLHTSQIRSILNDLGNELRTAKRDLERIKATPLQHRARFQALLDETRERFRIAAESIHLPLLRDGTGSLDHVEALLDEYNFVAKLIHEHQLSERFATEMGLANFNNVHRLLIAFIELRCELSPEYASHFIRYVKEGRSRK
jgi:hypothetical protein